MRGRGVESVFTHYFYTQNRMWNSKTLAVFVLKMTGAFALGGKKKSSIL